MGFLVFVKSVCHYITRSKLGYQIITICNYGAGVSDQMEYFGVTEWKPIS